MRAGVGVRRLADASIWSAALAGCKTANRRAGQETAIGAAFGEDANHVEVVACVILKITFVLHCAEIGVPFRAWAVVQREPCRRVISIDDADVYSLLRILRALRDIVQRELEICNSTVGRSVK